MPEQNNYSQYTWFREKKTELSKLMADSSSIIDQLSMTKFADRLKQLSANVADDTFKIQIVGTFKNGKSTFINALLGEDILPTRALPCTAVVNEVKYGETKHAILNFVNPLPKHLLDTIPAPTLAHMKKYMDKGEPVPPMEIDYDDMDKYVTIPIDGDPEEIAATSPYKSVELFYPSPFLKEGVMIVDSPGLNEADSRTRVTLEYLDQADAIIYLFNATALCAQDEMEFIEDVLIPKGFNDMFFVVNRFDLIPEKEQSDIKQYAQKKAGGFSSRPIFFISAFNAVQGKTEHDETKLQSSGFKSFEEALSSFLTKDKGRIKLTQPARELNNIISKEVLFKVIPGQRSQLDTSLSTMRARYDSVKPQLDELEKQKQQLISQMSLRIEQSTNEVRRAVLNEYREITNSIPAWINDFTPQTKVGFASKSKIKKLTDEIVAYATEKTKAKFAEWKSSVLQPLVQDKAQYIFDSSDHDLTELFKAIDNVNSQMTGQDIEVEGVSGWQRVAGFATMMVAGSTGAGIMAGGISDGKSIAKHLAMDIGVGTGLALLGIVNPIFWIGGVVLLVWKGWGDGGKAKLKEVKTRVSTELVKSLREGASAKANEFAEQLKNNLSQISSNADSAIDLQINNVKQQVEGIMHDMEQGQAKVDARKELLNKCEGELQEINSSLDKLIFELAELS